MAQKKGGQMPQGQAGLIQYFDEDDMSMKFDPKWIVGGIVTLIILEILMQWMFRGAFV